MLRKEAVDKLDAIERGDNEAAHSQADQILLDFLRNHSFGDIAQAWENACKRAGFWYS